MAAGSFLNVCMDRLPEEQSIIKPPSHCPVCNRKLGPLDLVPVLSYLWLRGRCRYCRAPIPVRLSAVEMVTGLLFAFLYLRFGITMELGVYIVFTSLLIVIFVTDLEHQLVLDKITFPGMGFALLAALLLPGPGILKVLLGGGIGLAAMALPFLVYRRGMGLGDVKLGALIGLMTGYPVVITALLMAVISGGLFAAFLLIFKISRRDDAVPFATFLTTATVVSLFWGQEIWRWYLNLY
ncbi:MAG: prepilin peptidase [Dehalococcoidia bacterium]|nr:prepilin peptidase [Dehalococcoidia bacterium]